MSGRDGEWREWGSTPGIFLSWKENALLQIVQSLLARGHALFAFTLLQDGLKALPSFFFILNTGKLKLKDSD